MWQDILREAYRQGSKGSLRPIVHQELKPPPNSQQGAGSYPQPQERNHFQLTLKVMEALGETQTEQEDARKSCLYF